MGIKIEAGRDVKVGHDVTSVEGGVPTQPVQAEQKPKRRPPPWRAIVSALAALGTFLARQIKVK